MSATSVGTAPEAGGARYVPAASRRSLTRIYDPIIALTMRERVFRGRLEQQVLAGLPPTGATTVDVGAGTGTFAIALAAAAAGVETIGIDGDPEILALARAKPGADRVRWKEGLAQSLPLPDESADRVVISLVLHHLEPLVKRAALKEARRVLRPGGRVHVADFGRPRGLLPRVGFLLVRAGDGFAQTRDHAEGRLERLVEDAGFSDVSLHDRMRTGFGSLELISATRA